MQVEQLCKNCSTPMQLLRHEGKYLVHDEDKDRYAIYKCDQCDEEMKWDIANNKWVE